jgi:hypothetical protein
VAFEKEPQSLNPKQSANRESTLTERKRAFCQVLLRENTCEMKEILAKHRTEYRNQGKEYHESDGQIKDQTLYATPCLKDRTCTTTAEGTTQTCSSYLE